MVEFGKWLKLSHTITPEICINEVVTKIVNGSIFSIRQTAGLLESNLFKIIVVILTDISVTSIHAEFSRRS
jgi:hypothetical protein